MNTFPKLLERSFGRMEGKKGLGEFPLPNDLLRRMGASGATGTKIVHKQKSEAD